MKDLLDIKVIDFAELESNINICTALMNCGACGGQLLCGACGSCNVPDDSDKDENDD
ncbi:MAG: hypothetical protein KGY75_08770 [Candidatus Cloacimonetes bacterium]|nr:hypothetical protein [Candidatus Cloacimonadota bacterium]MBS3768189.1 hypothetical protein [Candidatus Cloacimonadota bacterium]